jgi:hypothetical protein
MLPQESVAQVLPKEGIDGRGGRRCRRGSDRGWFRLGGDGDFFGTALQLGQGSSQLPILSFQARGQPHDCQGEKEKDSTGSGLDGPKFHCHLIVGL